MIEGVRKVLEDQYVSAQHLISTGTLDSYAAQHGDIGKAALELARLQGRKGRGIVLTLAAVKAGFPKQDIRAHQTTHSGGFAARSVDTAATVPFLREKELDSATQSHWLTRRLVEKPFTGESLNTSPKRIGELVPKVIVGVQNAPTNAVAVAVVRILLAGLIEERNRSRIDLSRPKGLGATGAADLVIDHMTSSYSSARPRLPQLAIYALYRRLIKEAKRFEGADLGELDRLKSADRKAGTFGDINVIEDDRYREAVDVKDGLDIAEAHVREAIEKTRGADVHRYYLLSTTGVKQEDLETIRRLCADHYRRFRCEIIVGTVQSFLRSSTCLLEDPDDFIAEYADLVESDIELNHEHRDRWNALVDSLGGA